jgi:Macro domain
VIEALGNLWTHPADVIVITTNGFVKANGECVMGRGCAREARDRFPGIALKLGTLIKQHGNRPMRIWKYRNSTRAIEIVSFPTKHVWSDNSDPDLIVSSMAMLVDMADKFNWKRIVMPRPGCGNGGLNWADIKPLLETSLDGRFTVISFPARGSK